MMHPQTGWRLIGLAVALAGPGAVAVASQLAAPARLASALLGEAALWGLVTAVVLIVVCGERQSLASIGLVGLRWSSVALGIALAAAINLVMQLVLPILAAHGLVDLAPGIGAFTAWPLWLQLLAVVTAGIAEETLYRGYALTRLADITGSSGPAAALSIAAFAVVHLPAWGPGILLPVLIGSAILTGVFLWRRDLVIVIVAHVVTDSYGLIIAPLLATQ